MSCDPPVRPTSHHRLRVQKGRQLSFPGSRSSPAIQGCITDFLRDKSFCLPYLPCQVGDDKFCLPVQIVIQNNTAVLLCWRQLIFVSKVRQLLFPENNFFSLHSAFTQSQKPLLRFFFLSKSIRRQFLNTEQTQN